MGLRKQNGTTRSVTGGEAGVTGVTPPKSNVTRPSTTFTMSAHSSPQRRISCSGWVGGGAIKVYRVSIFQARDYFEQARISETAANAGTVLDSLSP